MQLVDGQSMAELIRERRDGRAESPTADPDATRVATYLAHLPDAPGLTPNLRSWHVGATGDRLKFDNPWLEPVTP